jgi:hypothetical protein
VPTPIKPLLSHILDDEALTRGLGDEEARILVEWLVEQAEIVAETITSEARAADEVKGLCRRCRAIGRFVGLWSHPRSRGAAGQLAAAERFAWPFPSAAADPCEIMANILRHEADERQRHFGDNR